MNVTIRQFLISSGLALLGIVGQTTLSSAQSSVAPVIGSAPDSIIYNVPVPPDQGAPVGRREGGAGRGECENYQELTALVPITQDMVWGQTASTHPSFWFYLPSAIAPGTAVEFVILDAEDNYVYSTRRDDVAIAPGLMRFTIPTTAEPLAIDASYSWTLSVYCNQEQPSESVFVSGMVQRIAAPSVPVPNEPLAQGQFYAEQGLWYDALDTLAMAYKNASQPEITQAWTDLLRQAELDGLAMVPFGECCTSDP